MSHLPPLPVVVAFLVAFVASFSRIFAATKPFWGLFPGWFQVFFPQLSLAVGALGAGLAGGVNSGTDLVVIFVAAAALLVPGVPSNRSSAPLPGSAKTPTVPPLGVLMVLVCFSTGLLGGCALFSPADYAHCLPTPADLLADVSVILKSPDYESKLKELALTKTEAAVVCAVEQFVDLLAGKVAASPDDAVSVSRGKAFLAKAGAK